MLHLQVGDHTCLLVRNTPAQMRLLAELPIKDFLALGHPVLVGFNAGKIAVAGKERESIGFASWLGKEMFDRLEERAYGLINEMLASLSGPASPDSKVQQHDILYSAYHEAATNAHLVLLVTEALKRGACIIIADEPLFYAFSKSAQASLVEPTPSRSGLLGLIKSVLRKPFGIVRRSIRLMSGLPRILGALRASSARDIVLVTCNDSGTGINSRPLQKILAEFDRQGVATLVLTETQILVDEFYGRGKRNIIMIDGDEPVWSSSMLAPRFDPGVSKEPENPLLSFALDGILAYYWPKYRTRFQRISRLLRAISLRKNIQAILSIPETLPVSISSGLWGRKRAILWLGHFTATIGRCPDHYFFPADEQLAYGEQLREHIIETGKDPESVHTVGCPTFDDYLGRDRAADRKKIDQHFKRAGGKKLVIVASEAFPDPQTELVPILSALGRLKGVHVILKLHPEDNLDEMKQMAFAIGVLEQIDITDSYALGELLGAADLLICVLSTIIIEAAVIGTPTLRCDFSEKSKILDFVEQGLCLGCSDPAMIGEQVESILFDQRVAKKARSLVINGISRFNGPNDARSAERIVRHVRNGIIVGK